MNPRQDKPKAIDIESLIARLEDIELSETFRDEYFHNTTLPILKDTSIMKKFGQLSQDDQDRMAKDAFDMGDINNPAKWAQLLYGSILSNRVRLSTFLSKEGGDIQAQEAFYSNYKIMKPLLEAQIDVTVGDRNDQTLFLKDPTEMRAYVKTDVDRNMYISGTESGQYKDYLQSSSNPKSMEGKKAKAFATAIVNQVKAAAVSDMERVFKGKTEIEMLNAFKAHPGIYAVLLDSITLALIDLLNQGTYSANYGTTTFKAAQALLGNNLLADQPVGYKSLKGMNPEAAADIETKLTAVMSQINPYMVDIRKMHTAFVKARSSQSLYTTAINTMVSSFSNLVSAVGKTLGTTKFNFDDLLISPVDSKAQQLLDLTKVHAIYGAATMGSDYLINPFLRIVTKEMRLSASNGFAIVTDLSNGVAFEKDANSGGRLHAKTINKDSKGAFIAEDAHRHILNEVLKQYGTISPTLYTRVLSSIETKADSQANTFQGNEKTTKDQLLTVLEHLFNPSTHQLETGKVLFALVPKALIEGSLIGLKTTDKRVTVPGAVLEPTRQTDEAAGAIYSDLRPMMDIYLEYMSLLLNFNTDKQTLLELPTRFAYLVQNLYQGVWTHDTLEGGGFGIASVLANNVRGEISLNSEVLISSDDMNAIRREGMSRFQNKERVL
jgi:hypothetical protein